MFALLTQEPGGKIRHVENPAPHQSIDEYGQLPRLASSFDHVDGLFYFTYAVCIFFFVLILGVIVVAVIKYRRKTWDQPALSNVTHNTPLEVVWTVIPLIIVMVMFAWGFAGSNEMTNVPLEASRNAYKVTASQWSWAITNPKGDQTLNEIWVEAGKPVAFHLESRDVLHAFSVPSMRVKRDIVPGRMQTLWFTPGLPKGAVREDHHVFCAEYCGEDHSRMYAKLIVLSPEEFRKQPWVVPWDDSTPEAAAKSAERIYRGKCSSCHSLNGSPLAGPSWKSGPNSVGLFAKAADGTVVGLKREVLVAGQRQEVTVDEAYIFESIRNPSMKVVADDRFARNAMPPQTPADLSDREIRGLIELMKSLAEAK